MIKEIIMEKNMLTIQPAQFRVAFEAKQLREEQINAMLSRRSLSPEQIALLEQQDLTPEQKDLLEEHKYRTEYNEMASQRDEFTKLASDNNVKIPEFAKMGLKGGAVVTSGILGGMAAGWGTKKSIKGFEKLFKTEFVKNTKNQIKATNKFAKESIKTLKTNFIESEAYKLHQARLEKGRQSKFWGPVLKFFGSIGKGIKFAYTKVKNGIKFVINKIKGVKSETYKKAAVNTVGVSGGIASGATALKESDEAKK